ncbi:THAP domain-containing protein 7-like [Hydractinia symbiolongicarpus]|uniref:THAP domain-containing protein 7-like n=1 Tax=Hydractinia symbiolongicarpus TaxID=13093 RepID=UPI00254DA3F7|nr:THAP domain-containing protein 7-like [Hydractinia symbiolongicarpus]
MPNCAAIGCTNRSSNNKKTEKGKGSEENKEVDNEKLTTKDENNNERKIRVVFYHIPSAKKDKELRNKWLHNIKRSGTLPKDSGFYICSHHFEPECFERDLQAELMGPPPRNKLKDGAVPTLFNFTKQPEKRKRTEKRIEDRQKRQEPDKKEAIENMKTSFTL